jgi:hypothetical protein
VLYCAAERCSQLRYHYVLELFFDEKLKSFFPKKETKGEKCNFNVIKTYFNLVENFSLWEKTSSLEENFRSSFEISAAKRSASSRCASLISISFPTEKNSLKTISKSFT